MPSLSAKYPALTPMVMPDLTLREVWQYVNQLVDERAAQARAAAEAEMAASRQARMMGRPGG